MLLRKLSGVRALKIIVVLLLSLLRFGSFLLFDVLKDLTKQSAKLHVCLMCFVSDQEFRLVLGPW